MELIGVSALARALGIAKGTVSKQAAAGKIPVAQRDAQDNPLFDLDAVKLAREKNLNPLMRRDAGGGDTEPDDLLDRERGSAGNDEDGAAGEAERRSPRPPSGLVQQQQLEKQLKNRLLLRKVAEDEGLLCLRSIVNDDQTTFARRTRDGVTGQMADKASSLYAFIGERPRTEAELRVWLDEHTGQAFEEVAKLIAQEDEDEFGAEPVEPVEPGEPDAGAAS